MLSVQAPPLGREDGNDVVPSEQSMPRALNAEPEITPELSTRGAAPTLEIVSVCVPEVLLNPSPTGDKLTAATPLTPMSGVTVTWSLTVRFSLTGISVKLGASLTEMFSVIVGIVTVADGGGAVMLAPEALNGTICAKVIESICAP